MQRKTIVLSSDICHSPAEKRRRIPHLWMRVLALCLAVFCAFLLLEQHIRPNLRAVIEYESNRYAITAFNDALTAHLAQSPDIYQNLYSVVWDADDIPTSVVSNSYEINVLRSELTQQIFKSLLETKSAVYSFHLGRLTGIQMFAAAGPVITLAMEPESYIITEVYHTLEEAGDNQTLLSVYVKATVQINVSMAGYLQSVTVENEMLVWQNLLLGRVPDVNV